MVSFLFRLARRAALTQKARFAALTGTLCAASVLLVVLSALSLNAESQLTVALSGVPNLVVEPHRSIVATSTLATEDVATLKSQDHFWSSNIRTAAPLDELSGSVRGDDRPIAATWFRRTLRVGEREHRFGLLTFDGWTYRGETPRGGEVIVGANVQAGDSVRVVQHGTPRTYPVAGKIETGGRWDNYVFLDWSNRPAATESRAVDKILVSALIKPTDQLAVRAARYGSESLSEEEYERWSCSPYASSVAHSIEQVLSQVDVRVLRRVTGVQAGIIRASSGVFLFLFLLTLIVGVTAIFSAEKMYVTAHLQNFGIMRALGGSRRTLILQLFVELSLASVLSGVLTYALSKGIIRAITQFVLDVPFEAETTLLLSSLAVPFLISIAALGLLYRNLTRDTSALLP